MFKFIKSRFGQPTPVVETQRQTIDRALSDVNAIVALMDPKPKVTFDPNSGSIALELPAQMPDEALALPAPTEETEEDTVQATK